MESDQVVNILLISPDEIFSEPVDVTLLPENRVRLEEPAAMIEEVAMHDILETAIDADGSHRIVRIVESANFRRYEYAAGGAALESERVRLVLEKVQGLGGQWAATLGMLVINLPPDCPYDPADDLSGPAPKRGQSVGPLSDKSLPTGDHS